MRMLVNYTFVRAPSPGEDLAKFNYLIQEIQIKHTTIFIYAVKFMLHTLKHFYERGGKIGQILV